ncbi:retinitis pigmentosa 1-like 1 protein [Phyllostomus discolor]|uniref:Retinitis pigmentosa 1-like 1 protein n=1 Tax=Phyllostomus discolor TaxID=89673 RepID=A0A7E6CIH7_9CHIR|nr:retinitis pigmentosa 1-like 1 protein [Phyllostomus discolor]
MGARGRGLWGPFSRPPTTLVPWGLGHPQTLPEFRVFITPGWGHPEPAPSLPGGVSVSPGEPVRSMLPHEVTKDRPLSWSPSPAQAPPGALPQLHPYGCPTDPGPAPRVRGGCRRRGRLPWVESGCWVGRLSGLLGWGDRQAGVPPPRAQRQEVHLRQPLHSIRGQAAGGPSAPEPGEARSDTAPRWESPGVPAEPTPGCLQELGPTTRSSFGEPGNSEFKNRVLEEERGQAEPTTHRPLPPPSGSPQGRKIPQEVTGPSGLPKYQDSAEGLGWSLNQDRTELQKLLGIEIPQSQREETPQGLGEEAPQGENKEAPPTQTEKANQGQSGEAPQALGQEVSGGLGWETPQGEEKDALQDPKGNCPKCPRKETPQSQEVKDLPSAGGRGWISQAWGVAQGEVPTPPREEGGSWGTRGDFCESLGEQISQSGRREGPGPGGRDVQLTRDKTHGQRQGKALAVGEQRAGQEGALAPLQLQRPLAQPQLSSAGAVMLSALSTPDSEQQERPTALPGHPGLVRNRYGRQDPGGGPGSAEQQMGEAKGPGTDGSERFPGPLEERWGAAEGPKAPKAAWPGPPGKEKASAGLSAAQLKTALQRLLELQGAARRRRWQDREQQRLRVLDRLRIARNRLCRVHPLGPPPSPAHIQPQDMEGQQHALREQLEQVHRERTGRLWALGARNTQNFQQLLCPPGAEEPAPGK